VQQGPSRIGAARLALGYDSGVNKGRPGWPPRHAEASAAVAATRRRRDEPGRHPAGRPRPELPSRLSCSRRRKCAGGRHMRSGALMPSRPSPWCSVRAVSRQSASRLLRTGSSALSTGQAS